MELKLKDATLTYITECGFNKLTDIQEATIRASKEGKDLVAISPTGTGKTHAFLLSIMEKIDLDLKETQVIISSPTRELALQLFEVFKTTKKIWPDINIKLVMGGSDSQRNKEAMKKEPHIVIGTPGRLRDFYEEGLLRVDHTQMFIIDEADMTLEFGFLVDIDKIFARMNSHPEVMCFSATLPEGLRPFIKRYLEDPEIIFAKSDEDFDPNIDHVLIACKHLGYSDTLLTIIDGFKPYVCLIFANDRETCDVTYRKLSEAGLRVGVLHGGLDARQRKRTLKSLMRHEYTYLVATDIAARGLDIKGVTHVVSLGLPSDLSFYIHRSGRTGRIGHTGTCFLLYRDSDLKGIDILTQKGIEFKSKAFKDGNWRDVKKRVKPIGKNNELEKSIAKTLHRKKEKVKPNYKKKKAREIEAIKRKKRQEYIRQKIKEEKKARYKKRANES